MMAIYCRRHLNHEPKGEMENDSERSRRQQKLKIFLFSLACLLDLFVRRSQLLRGQQNE